MAGIDKTYTNSYKDYKEFKDWADTQYLTFFDGHKVCIGNWVCSCEKDDFDYGEIPIMNTPTWLDVYLIQNCKSKFVLDRMMDVYDEEFYSEAESINLSAAPPEDFKQNRKIVIKRIPKTTKYRLHSKPFYGETKWWVQSCDGFQYNDNTKTWTNSDYYPSNTNTSLIPSIKSLIRHLRKQYLPNGAKFRIIGRYVGEEYLVVVK